MIKGVITEIVEPRKRFKVEIKNNPELLERNMETTEDNIQKALDQRQTLLDTLYEGNYEARISFIESQISELREQGGQSALLQINQKYIELKAIFEEKTRIEERINQLDVYRRNLARVDIYNNREPVVYEYNIYSSTDRVLEVGDEVGVIFHSYDTETAVIAPEYENEGFGRDLTGIRLLNAYEWLLAELSEPFLSRTNTRFKKGTIYEITDDDRINVDADEVFKKKILGGNKQERVKIDNVELFLNCNWTYTTTDWNPYKPGDSVLLKISGEPDNRTATVIGFWQEPQQTFEIIDETEATYLNGLTLKGGMTGDFVEQNGEQVKSYLRTTFKDDIYNNREQVVSEIFPPDKNRTNFEDSRYWIGFLRGLTSSGMSENNMLDTYGVKDEFYDFDGRFSNLFTDVFDFNGGGSRIRISDDTRNEINEFNSPRICNGVEYNHYYNGRTSTSSKSIQFNYKVRTFTNYVRKIRDGKAYILNGIMRIGDPSKTCFVDFNDGEGIVVRNFDEPEVQDIYNDFCNIIQNKINELENPESMYLYTREDGQHYNTFKEWMDAVLQKRIFFNGGIGFLDEKVIDLNILYKNFNVFKASNSRSEGTNDYQDGQGGYHNVADGLFTRLGVTNWYDNDSFERELMHYDELLLEDKLKDSNVIDHEIGNLRKGDIIEAGVLGNERPILVTNDMSRFENEDEKNSYGTVRDVNVTNFYRYYYFDYVEIEYVN